MQTILAFVVVFGTIVFIHEFGHFLFAKRAGMLVREFAIGFGPKLLSHKKDETLYAVRLLPLGGYVRVAGEDPEIVDIKTGKEVALQTNQHGQVSHIFLNPKQSGDGVRGRVMDIDLEHQLFIVLVDEEGRETRYRVDRDAQVVHENKSIQIAPWDRQYGAQSVGKRAAFVFGGPLFNVVLAILMFGILAFAQGVPDYVSFRDIEPDSPAQEAGLQSGDRVLTVEGANIHSGMTFIQEIQAKDGEPIHLTVDRNGEKIQATVDPTYNDETKMYVLGVYTMQHNKSASPLTAAKQGFVSAYSYTVGIFDSFGMLIRGEVALDDLAGPVGIADLTGQVARAGFLNLVQWTAFLSLYLGIFNLLPVPAMDGSRLLFIGLEALRGRPIDPNKESMVHLVGFALLMILMVVVTYNDILRFLS